MKNVTIRDIANKAGVSETTVSLSFQPNSRISHSTREKVLQIAHDMRYVRNTAAQNLRGGRTKTIGFIVNDINNSFYNTMSRVAANIANKHGFQIIYAETEWDPEKAIEVTKNMLAKRVEGLMLSLSEKEEVSLELIRHTKTPFVVIDTIPQSYKGPYVINNEIAIGKIAGEHLAKLGCKKIAFFNASKKMASFSAFTLQLQGLKISLDTAGIFFSTEDVYYSGLTMKEGAIAFRDLLKTKGNIYDGILCANDYVAYGIMDEAERNGISIGKDLALIGIDNLEFSALNRISLTSIDIDYQLMTSIAISNLITTIENNIESSIGKILEPKLIERGSTQDFIKL